VTETGPEIASLIGADPVELEIADLDGGDGQIIELIRYIRPAGRPTQARSSDPGSAYIAVQVEDIDAAFERIQGSQGRQISRRPIGSDRVQAVAGYDGAFSRLRFETFTLGTLAVIIAFAVACYWLGRPVREQKADLALVAAAPA